jgi:hypothetical protein
MRKKFIGIFAAGLFTAVPAMAQEAPQAAAPTYNCDFQPSCEVAPGIYGKKEEPVTSKFKLSIGGFVKLDYAYNSVNFGNSIPARAPGNGQIPKTSSVAGQQDQSVFTARQSRLWFKVAGPTFLGAKTNALIEADFYGAGASNENADIRLRHAYGTLDWANTQVRFGQTSDLFGPAVASSIDFSSGAPYGAPNQPRVPQISIIQKVNLTQDNALKLAVGIQNPPQDSNSNATGGTYGTIVNVAAQAFVVSKALGVAPGYYGMPMNSFTAGFFGLWGSEKVSLTTGDKSVDSWGYGFYTFVPVLSSKDGKSRAGTLSFEGQAYFAANSAFNQATGGTVVGSAAAPTGAKGYGLFGQAIFYPVQDLGFTAGYGRRNAYNYASYAGKANFEKSNTNIFFNVAYDLNAAVRVAAEYQNLNTQYGNVTNGTGNLAGLSGTGTANVGRFAVYYFF